VLRKFINGHGVRLSFKAIEQIVEAVEPFQYDRVYGAFGTW
jgi:hypothetical protein